VFFTDEDVMRRESTLRDNLKNDSQYKVKTGASVEVAQYNPPFTLPFTRRNEISLEVERKEDYALKLLKFREAGVKVVIKEAAIVPPYVAFAIKPNPGF
ncbi:heme-binding-like protein, chloroplastic, partial [Tanacetum coccineum]